MVNTSKDWTGNSRSTYVTLGASNHSQGDRADFDFYATDPKALELLLRKEKFNRDIWECACGDGHLSKVLEQHGYNVLSTDLIQRQYGIGGVDFLNNDFDQFDGDIITNPPYKYAKEFVEKALELLPTGNKVAMFLKIQFLEGKARRNFFEVYPPKYIYVSTGRIRCAMNGDFEQYSSSSASCYAWFIWQKGFQGEPTVRWFN